LQKESLKTIKIVSFEMVEMPRRGGGVELASQKIGYLLKV